MKREKFIWIWLGLLIILVWQDISAAELKGKFAISAKGGVCSSLGSGFGSENSQEGRYGLGISAEYFFLEALSGGLTLAHNSFEGKWQGSYYDSWDKQLGYTGWSWTNVSIFTRFVMGPRSEASPYFVAGMGLYIPRITDKFFRAPDTVYTHTSYGKGQWGFHFGCGIQYLITQKLLLFLELPITSIHTKGSQFHWMDLSHWIGQEHRIYDDSQWVNVFAGISFLW